MLRTDRSPGGLGDRDPRATPDPRGGGTCPQRHPLTITSFPAKLSEGGRNDFYSNGDYWWPDPTKPNGLPYLRRDGQTNPENFGAHRNALNTFRDQVAALAAAYRLTHEEKYAAHAVRFLDTFLLDPSTRMNPHLKFAQAIPGRNPGRGIGIIDTLHLIEIPKAIAALRGSRALTVERAAGLRRWFSDYKDWMLASDNGKEEANEKNNHAVAFWLQVAVFAEFTGDPAALRECQARFTQKFIGMQMALDGGFPLELARTKPYAYSLFQLDNLSTLGWVLSTDGGTNYWHYTLPDGRGLAKGAEFMTPYVQDKSRWTRPRMSKPGKVGPPGRSFCSSRASLWIARLRSTSGAASTATRRTRKCAAIGQLPNRCFG